MHTWFHRLLLCGVCVVLISTAVNSQTSNAITLNSATSLQMLTVNHGRHEQYIRLNVTNPGKPVKASVHLVHVGRQEVSLATGQQNIDVSIPVITDTKTLEIKLFVSGSQVDSAHVIVQPVRQWDVYLLPHSHVDIGYTKVQTEVEADQMRFLDMAIAEAKRTASYPPECRFKWNTEVMWAVDSYLRIATPEQRTTFTEAVRNGSIGLDALYGNELTGLCRPEELVRLTSFACRTRDELRVPIDSAMISDVPGYTWGLMSVLGQSHVQYFSIGPNRSDRLGSLLRTWGDRPFYWVSPSGQEKVLCWVAAQGYSWFHGKGGSVGDKVLTYLSDLDSSKYPYDIVHLRYNIGGDNGPPDLTISDYVRDWNEQHVSPKLHIALVHDLFEDFEKRYADDIPAFSGDITPYWEDGAASTARETAQNRAAAERLVQAETLWTMFQPQVYPADRFRDAWRNVVLYDEHTWGAHNSISEPDSDFAKAQWAIKQTFAVNAEKESQSLLDDALAPLRADGGLVENLLVLNTCSWPRTQLVIIPASMKTAGDRIVREKTVLPSQRLSNGDLEFVATDVPALGSKKFSIQRGKAESEGNAHVDGATISNGEVTATVDPKTGTIASFTSKFTPENLVDTKGGAGLNEYLYVPGTDPKGAMRAGAASMTVVDKGPLVATLRFQSGAPGVNSIVRELRVVDGLPYMEISNVVDKQKQRKKEGVHFAYPFNVPDGVIHSDLAWSVIRPEQDQLPGSCKNWITTQRWVDVSNPAYGVTWATLDAPLVEFGGVTAEAPWISTLPPTQTILSYVMNNYWFTNYRDSQDGIHTFRYALLPHGTFNCERAQQFGIELSQPLVVIPVKKDQSEPAPLLAISPTSVIVTALKRSEDGKATVLRLFAAAAQPVSAKIARPDGSIPNTCLSDLTERVGDAVQGNLEIPAFGIVTVRVDL